MTEILICKIEKVVIEVENILKLFCKILALSRIRISVDMIY